MRDASDHRAKRAEAFPLHDLLLGGAQLAERLLEFGRPFAHLFFEPFILLRERDMHAARPRRLVIRNIASVRSKGFERKSVAPAPSACFFVVSVTSAVSTITGTNSPGSRMAASCAITAKPSRCGIIRSSRIKSGSNSAHSPTTLRESVVARRFVNPSSPSSASSSEIFIGSSSTSKIRMARDASWS
jgi:hypothetical protein